MRLIPYLCMLIMLISVSFDANARVRKTTVTSRRSQPVTAASQPIVREEHIALPVRKCQHLDDYWLQSYNAGPYALLRYRGNVPYRETRTYVERVKRYYREDLSNTPYEPYIQRSAQEFCLDPQMIRAIMKAESDFRPRCVSSAGARGLMQVMPCAWREVKTRLKLTWSYYGEVFNPEKNIYVACAYLGWLRHEFIPTNMEKLQPQKPKAVNVTVVSRKRSRKRKQDAVDAAARIYEAKNELYKVISKIVVIANTVIDDIKNRRGLS